jgi:Ca2+-binding EF-hand superfamily protein
MLNQYDKNKNGTLEKEEWSLMKPERQKADANGDGIITVEELTAQLAAYGKSSPSSSSKPSGASDRKEEYRSSPSVQVASNGHAMRFLTPSERLPSGLPGWFTQSDRDGDGQVMMSEYSSYWSEDKIKEFSKYDLNADGTITPGECLSADRGSRGR